jgi:hypothetical protein
MNQNQIPEMGLQDQQNLIRKKQELAGAFKSYHELVSNKVLDKNKSPALKNTEKQVVDRLVKSAVALENINIGEGILSLASIAIREQLIVRDRVNELEYELLLLKREVDKLKNK